VVQDGVSTPEILFDVRAAPSPRRGGADKGEGTHHTQSSLPDHDAQAARRRPRGHHAAAFPNPHTKTGSTIGQGAVPASGTCTAQCPGITATTAMLVSWHYSPGLREACAKSWLRGFNTLDQGLLTLSI